MGLAASQSRFLAITARKANCEYQSMDYAQQKLSISRKLTNATEDYKNSLNATKLVWDASGTETSMTDLSYNVMMTPSALNGYDPYLLTDSSGRVVLDDKYAAAAKAAGIDQKGGSNSKTGRDAFVQALAEQGIISGSMAEVVQNNEYIENAGRGAESLDKSSSNAVTLGGLATYFNSQKDSSTGQLKYALNLDSVMDLSTFDTNTGKYQDGKNNRLSVNGDYLSSSQISELTLGDLLTSNVILSTYNGDIDTLATQVKKLVEQIADALGRNSSEYTGLYTDSTSLKALEDAYALTIKQFSSTNVETLYAKTVLNFDKNAATQLATVKTNASGYNQITYARSTKAVSLSNVFSSFLTYYAQALEGYTCGYSVRDDQDDSVMVTEDSSYYYVLYNDGSISNRTDLLYTDFYNIMYNNICSNGWTQMTGADVNDSEYLSHALKNGQMFISSLNSDGYYYQGTYTENGYVTEVTDDDAIAVAEAEYNKIKTELSYKEEKIDLQTQNLDLEISSLTTEYDTIKNLISKSIEKTFTMFSS